MSHKIVVDLPDDMYDALTNEKDTLGIPIAVQVRRAIQSHLDARGVKVSATLAAWGGKRERSDPPPADPD